MHGTNFNHFKTRLTSDKMHRSTKSSKFMYGVTRVFRNVVFKESGIYLLLDLEAEMNLYLLYWRQ